MRAEGVLRDTGAEGVGRERALAAQQLEGGGVGPQVQDALLGADRAAAVRQEVEIDLGAEPHATAMAPAFPRFQHVGLLTFSVAYCYARRQAGEKLEGRWGNSRSASTSAALSPTSSAATATGRCASSRFPRRGAIPAPASRRRWTTCGANGAYRRTRSSVSCTAPRSPPMP